MNTNLNIVAFIPARSGSKTIPGKNVKLLGDKPLLAYSIESAFSAGIQRVIVNTDNVFYAKTAKEYGAEIMIRPSSLSKDSTSMVEVLRSEIKKISPLPDLVLLLQPTSPFRNKNHITIAISYLTENLDEFDSVVSVEKVPDKYNPAVVFIQTPSGKGMVMTKITTLRQKIKSLITGKTWTRPSLTGSPISQRITNRQNNPEAWVPTGSVYLFKTKNLEQGSLYGEKVMLLETEPRLNLNSQEDWDKAEEYLKSKENAKS